MSHSTLNCAELGGGAYFFSDRFRTPDSNNRAIFEKSSWTNIFAHTGSAVDTLSLFMRTQTGYLPTPIFRDCKFIGNTIEPTEELKTNGFTDTQSKGSGTLYSSLMNLKFADFTLFEDNIGSWDHRCQ